METIKNEDLKLDKIPKSLEEGAVHFAHTFNGYEFHGSFQKCGDVAKKVNKAIEQNETTELTLSELRTAIFFYFRAMRHGGTEPDKSIVDKFLNLIRDRVEQERLD